MTKVKSELDESPSGIYSISYEDYSKIEAVNYSTLKEYNKTPAHYLAAKTTAKEPSKPFFEGNAWHTYILEKEKFKDQYVVEPDLSIYFKNQTDQKNWQKENPDKTPQLTVNQAKEQFKEQSEGKLIVTNDLMNDLEVGRAELFKHPDFPKIFELAEKELSFVTIDQDTGLKKKGRLDLWLPNHSMVFDLKTCNSIDDFHHDIKKYKYNVQLAYYSDLAKEHTGQEIKSCGVIAIEKNKPFFSSRIFMLPKEVIEEGRRFYKRYLDIHQKCVAQDQWPSHVNPTVEFNPKPWFFDDELPNYPVFKKESK